MATIVCQGLQSCLESHLVEPRTLRLRLSTAKVVVTPHSHFSDTFTPCFLDSNTKPPEEKCQQLPDNNHSHSSNADPGSCRSFLDAILKNGSQLQTTEPDNNGQNTYVHPLSKRSSSTLSEKSLELCTESLGSETGTDIIRDSGVFSLSSDSSSSSSSSSLSSSSSDSECGNFPTREQRKSHDEVFGRKKKGSSSSNYRDFPPPLTTISGLESLQVRPHREDGRLIIEAVKAPSSNSLFQAERSHGRLRLTIFKDSLPPFDSEEETEVAQKQDEEEMSTNETTAKFDDDTTNKDFDKEKDEILEEGENGEEGDDDDEEDEDEIDGGYRGEDMDGINEESGGKMGIKKFERSLTTGRRCKEDGHESGGDDKNGLLNWEPLWVATS